MEPIAAPRIAVIGREYIPLDRNNTGGCEGRLRLWNNSEEHDLWIDKHDVRGLFDHYSDFKVDRAAAEELDEKDEGDSEMDYQELMYERYQDMLDVKECDLMNLTASSLSSHGGSSGDLRDISATTAMTTNSYTQYDVNAVSSDPFIKPAYSFPSNIKHFPDTMTQYNVILHTAHAVRGNPQLEILLKVKQRSNPKFYFLEDDHNSRCNLYPLYKHLRDLDDENFWLLLLGKISSASYVAEENRTIDESVGMNALSLLGEYSDSDSDHEDEYDNEHKRPQKVNSGKAGNAEESSQKSVCSDEDEHDIVGSCVKTNSLSNGVIDVLENSNYNENVYNMSDDECVSESNVSISDSDLLLDSDVDETLKCFWTRRSRLLKERKASYDKKKQQRRERLRKAKIFTERLSVTNTPSRGLPVRECEENDDSVVNDKECISDDDTTLRSQDRERMHIHVHSDTKPTGSHARKRKASSDSTGVGSGRSSVFSSRSRTMSRSPEQWRMESHRFSAFSVEMTSPFVVIDSAAVQRKIQALLQG